MDQKMPELEKINFLGTHLAFLPPALAEEVIFLVASVFVCTQSTRGRCDTRAFSLRLWLLCAPSLFK